MWLISTLPGPHDYKSAGIVPALGHVGAGDLEECQLIRVEYRGGGALVCNTIRFTVSPSWGPTLAGRIYPDPGECRWRVEYRLGTLYRATLPP